MMSATVYHRVSAAIESAKSQIEQITNKMNFLFTGFDEEYIYFNLTCRRSKIAEQELQDLDEKTRFYSITKTSGLALFKAEYKMLLPED